MNVRIYNKSLQVGVIHYQNLHNKIVEGGNLLDIKRLIDKFIVDSNIEGNIWFKGVTIDDRYVYIIKNKISGKEYIGSTINVLSRIYSYITMYQGGNDELLKDFINYGLNSFDIEYIPSDNIRDLEKEYIKNSNNCYNIVGRSDIDRSINIPRKGEYKIGGMNFTSKESITKYIRKTLDSLKVNTYLDLRSDFAIMITDLVKYSKNYELYSSPMDDPFFKIKVVKDNIDGVGTGKYNILCLEYNINGVDKKWPFSTKHPLKYITKTINKD